MNDDSVQEEEDTSGAEGGGGIIAPSPTIWTDAGAWSDRERERIEQECSDVGGHEASYQRMTSNLRTAQNQLSNFGDERPISFVGFAPGSSLEPYGSIRTS